MHIYENVSINELNSFIRGNDVLNRHNGLRLIFCEAIVL